jgi:hypothetical protein
MNGKRETKNEGNFGTSLGYPSVQEGRIIREVSGALVNYFLMVGGKSMRPFNQPKGPRLRALNAHVDGEQQQGS